MKEIAKYLKLLTNIDTIKIIIELDSGPKRPRELKRKLKFSYAKISYHLTKLKECEIVEAKKYGFFSKYRLQKTDVIELLKMSQNHHYIKSN